MRKIPYSFHDRLILRTPLLPLFDNIDEQGIKALPYNERFMEALYLASPVLYDECLKWKNDTITCPREIRKISGSLAKYYTRMSSRCTPFGLFSGCSVIKWSDTEAGDVVLDSREIRRHTRLDMQYLCALAQKIALLPGIKEGLRYFPNTSMYTIGDEIRWVEYEYKNNVRCHQVSAVMRSDYLDAILDAARGGITWHGIAAQLVADGAGMVDALAFADELTGAQLLVSELEPSITGKEFIHQVLNVLGRIDNGDPGHNAGRVRTILQEAHQQLTQLDSGGVRSAEAYRAIISLLELLEVPYEENRLFQADMRRVMQGDAISVSVREELLQSLNVLNRLAGKKENKNLKAFAANYYRRFEDKEMPLAEVMDPDTGIGYLKGGNTHAPLVEDIVLSGGPMEQDITWGRLESFLKDKLLFSHRHDAYVLEIKEEDLEGFAGDWQDLPPSLSVMFRAIGQDNKTLYIESAGGSSAANLLGRFAHADEAIHDIVCDITKAEQENDPGVIYAEIVHLPDNRCANVLLHPVFREYEIPFLAKSSVAEDYRIGIQDLMVSVRNGRVLLRSRRLNKQVIPRLSTAHNYSNNTLPLYQFLCDLQTQDQRNGLGFSWGILRKEYQFLPRVTYRNTILQAASWHLYKKDAGDAEKGLAAFREKWKLPRHVVLADSDNELLIDFESPLLVQTWLETIKNREAFVLKEFFCDKGATVKDEQGRPYSNQMVAVLIKDTGSFAPDTISAVVKEGQAARKFTPGSEWLYYKWYCGIKSADKILEEVIAPLTEALLESGLIDKWFFIRYSDPDFHLRVRFHMPDESKIGELIRHTRFYLEPFERGGYIWRSQADTYNREIERYGSNTIEATETLFYHDSVAMLQLLDHTSGDERENIRWLWGLRSADELLNSFRLTLAEKYSFITKLKDAFAAEFNMNRSLKMQLDQKYRHSRPMIDRMMGAEVDEHDELYPLINILQERSGRIAPVADGIRALRGGSMTSLLTAYIHMLLNRLMPSDQRLHEMVIYDFLFRQYQSKLAREKSGGIAEKIKQVVEKN